MSRHAELGRRNSAHRRDTALTLHPTTSDGSALGPSRRTSSLQPGSQLGGHQSSTALALRPGSSQALVLSSGGNGEVALLDEADVPRAEHQLRQKVMLHTSLLAAPPFPQAVNPPLGGGEGVFTHHDQSKDRSQALNVACQPQVALPAYLPVCQKTQGTSCDVILCKLFETRRASLVADIFWPCAWSRLCCQLASAQSHHMIPWGRLSPPVVVFLS